MKLNKQTLKQIIKEENIDDKKWSAKGLLSLIDKWKNKGLSPFFAYDAGVRLDLVTDYFEIYFPVYSNLGWEISQSNYPQKIRFVFTTDFSALAELFTRRWF